MRISYYNFLYPYSEELITIYNSKTGAMANLDKHHYRLYNLLEKNNVPIEDEIFVNNLKKGGFVIDDNYCELDDIRFESLKGKFLSHNLVLVIAPTNDCNFRCPYCYEKDYIAPNYITEEVENSIIEFVMKVSESLTSIQVTWYGGEPMLAFRSIEKRICYEI